MIIGGFDIGTTGCKLVLYNEQAQLQEAYYREYDTVHQNGRHEIDFSAVKSGVLDLLKNALSEYRIEVLGITSFGETFVMLDDEDRILAPSMLYTDPRGEEECKKLCAALGEEKITLLTGVKPHSMYSISKILWQKEHNPKAFSACRKILLGEDFIVYTLTGETKIDYSLAARTGAFDVERKCWVKEIFEAAGVNEALMSTPVPSGHIAGKLKDEFKKEWGIDQDVVIVNGCHDQVANMIGAGVFQPSQAMDGTGTVECIPVVLPKKPQDIRFYQGGYSVVPYIGESYACYAFSFTGGAALKWFRDNFAEYEYREASKQGRNIYAELDRRVKEGPTGILVLPHFAGAATPYMDNYSKAAFVGVTLETTKVDLYKALMEGTSYEILLNFNTMKSMTGEISEIKATGGGATSDVWLQIKADILNTNIIALSCQEVGAAGTAALAAVAGGAVASLSEMTEKMAVVRRVIKPNPQNAAQYAELYRKYANLYRAIKGL